MADVTCRLEGQRAARGASRIWAVAGMIAVAALTFVVGGFFVFLAAVSQFGSVRANQYADAIVVLTGGQSRVDEAFRLLSEDKGRRLLISGVNPSASRETLRKTFSTDDARFVCCVDVDREALDTTGNATETAQWVGDHGYHSLIVVTNDYHMPRSLLEMRRAMHDVELVPHAVVNGQPNETDPAGQADRYRVLLGEYVKYSAARLRALMAPDPEPSATRRAALALQE